MKRIIGNSVIIIALLSCSQSLSYFYHLCVMRKVMNKQTNAQQLIICLGDYHLKSHTANKDQRMHVESLLKKCAAVKGKLIVEDLSSVNNDGRMVCCNFGINCSEGVLGQLANKARALGVCVDNVEYRYCRVAGIGPLLNNCKATPHSFRSAATIAMSSLHKEVVDEIEKIKKYNDGKILNDLYKRAVSTMRTALSKINFNDKKTVADYCAQLPRKQYRQELEKLCIFDSILIDMNIMHSIAACPHEQVIFVIAGGSHIEQVTNLLTRMGYGSVFSTSAATAESEVHPAPVDITIIDRFIR
ncbi:MAG TPA: hypothetical protein VKR54_02295 [Candidatus Babeliales bacterium]|nr:hypothetical protein [Candidatus Babeliales bacterium]